MPAHSLPEEGIMPNFREGFLTLVRFKALDEGEIKYK